MNVIDSKKLAHRHPAPALQWPAGVALFLYRRCPLHGEDGMRRRIGALNDQSDSGEKMHIQKVMLAVAVCLAAAACATRQQATGTAVGAATGAVVAGPVGAVVGAGVGAVAAAPGGVVDRVEGDRPRRLRRR